MSFKTAGFFNAAAQLSNVLPTGTFAVFQVLAPSATNNGDCGVREKVLTSIMLFVLSALCCVSCFTDSYIDANGVLHPGFVNKSGLWNRTFRNAAFSAAHRVQGSTYTGNEMYKRSYADFVNAGVSVAALATFTLLTAPVTTCFYPHIAGSIVKTVPLLVGLLVSAICAFTNFRHGFGSGSSAAAPAQGPAQGPAVPAPHIAIDLGGYLQGL
ncbi:unnamed protein product [Sphagnum jensenii]|uniref:Uncharacterized protein n=1 Tax=Sphagnum jensenii TaxID=128206 RepID=A0ABP1AFV5_9BRYO